MLPAVATSQATQNVPPDHPVYAFIDRLVATRLVDRIIVGQRMLSRREVGRILAEARTKQGNDGSWIDRRLAEFSRDFPNDLARAPTIGVVGAELTAANTPGRGIEPDGNGSIDVVVNPLL